ncbi:dTDP-4-dehydrorhamnose reductase [Bdellovibrio bacteriovorus]|uniref:dTDP-4-dehydrorhamnose reductase n=1 Tax=Bdellovibrio bacteriovorus TaxID=959 RepID=UPI0035A58096
MRILVFGKNGQVAWELQRSLASLGETRFVGSNEVNFAVPEAIAQAIREYKPTCIVNAAAYTAVDKAESDESVANQVNGESVGTLAHEAKKIGATVLHYSTDYVFDGEKKTPYVETDIPSPLNAYGRSKLLGEKRLLEVGGDSVILRVSWVYGRKGSNFLRTMLRLGGEKEELKVVNDQVGAPTWSRHIADVTSHIISDSDLRGKSGIYHVSPQGETSWFGFASKIFELHNEMYAEKTLKIKSLLPIPSEQYPSPAQRPLNSRMSSGKLRDSFGLELPLWERSLELMMSDLW